MKVLHVVYNSHPDVNGGAIRTRYLAEAQVRLGVEAAVLSSPFQRPVNPARRDGVEYCNGVPYYRCYNGHDPARFMAPSKPWWERAVKLLALLPFAWRVRQVARRERVDLIHAHSLFFCGLAALIAGRLLGLPVVYEVRSLIDEGMEGAGAVVRGVYRLLENLTCRLASHVTVICEGLREEMAGRGVPRAKITVCGNGVDLAAHRPGKAMRRSNGDLVVGYIGALRRYEGLDLLIDGAAAVARNHPGLRVLIVGEGSARAELEKLCRLYALEKTICFTGRVAHEEIASYYDAIDLFVLPRRSTRITDHVTPLKPLEIMAHGKPLLAGDCGGHRELIADGVNGVLFPASDTALAGHIEAFLNDRERLRRLGRQARKWVERRRSWESQCRPVIELYSKLAGRREAPVSRVLLAGPQPGAVPTGGVETGIGMILRSDLAERHDIAVWDRSRPARRRPWPLRMAAHFARFLHFAAHIAARRPHILHIKSSSGANFAESAIYAGIGRALRRRVLLQLHSGDWEAWYNRQSRAGRWGIRWALRWPSQILVLSGYWRSALAPLVPADRLEVVPNGVEISSDWEPRRGAGGVLRVLTIATVSIHKGHLDILAAAGRLRDQPVRFVFAGPAAGSGEGERIRQRAIEMGLESLVEFRGAVTREEKWELLACSDVFLLPSHAEGMPNAILEAMAAALPVIATPAGAVPEMLGDGKGGRLVAAGRPEDLARALRELLHDPSLRERMGRWNRRQAETRYSFKIVEQTLDRLYRPAGEGRPAAPPEGFHAMLLRLRAPALFLLAAEMAARAVAPAPPQWRWPQTQFVSSPALGFALSPNQRSFSAAQPFRTNSLGLRGPEISPAKPPGVRRVLLLGDSIACGYGVSESDTFARRVEVLLNAASQTRFEVINAGVPSYNTAQEIDYFAREGLELDPDIAVVALYWNDIHDKAGISVDAAGRLVAARAGAPSGPLESRAAYAARNLLKRSRLLYLAADRWRAVGLKLRPRGGRETQLAVLQGRDHADVERGWRAIEAKLAVFAALCRARRIRPLVILLPMPQQLGGRFPRVRYQSVARAICERQGLESLDLLPAFEKAYAAGVPLFLPYDGDHPNAEGHAVIAGRLFPVLCSKEPSCAPERKSPGG
jgi:glycosyltransferase involved in cell wall biosynthesis/lysophospholipase L1-like esterase